MHSKGIDREVVAFAEGGGSIMGTCAGAILLAKRGDEQVKRTSTRLLGLMDMEVSRNAFGRQRESFETGLRIAGLDAPFPGVFIRAPAIRRVWGRCGVLGKLGKEIVMAKQENLIALTFHPELTDDPRVHIVYLRTML
jgi:5'-phosphate synthase pdxT subunit